MVLLHVISRYVSSLINSLEINKDRSEHLSLECLPHNTQMKSPSGNTVTKSDSKDTTVLKNRESHYKELISSNTLENDEDISEPQSVMCLPDKKNISERTVERSELTGSTVASEYLGLHNQSSSLTLEIHTEHHSNSEVKHLNETLDLLTVDRQKEEELLKQINRNVCDMLSCTLVNSDLIDHSNEKI